MKDLSAIPLRDVIELWKNFFQPFFFFAVLGLAFSYFWDSKTLNLERVTFMMKVIFYVILVVFLLFFDPNSNSFGAIRQTFTIIDVILIPISIFEAVSNLISLFKIETKGK